MAPIKLGRALRSAAKLPSVVKGGRRSRIRKDRRVNPIDGEQPIVILRVQVQGCYDLVAKDSGGTSDPYVVVTFMSDRHQTPASKRTLSPAYAADSATFDFPVYLSLAESLGAVELIVWDKDLIKKDYLGETSILVEDWFKSGKSVSFSDSGNTPFSLNLTSSRPDFVATGTIQVKMGLVAQQGHDATGLPEIYDELSRRSRESQRTLLSAPPTEGMGTIRSHQGGPEFEDDGLSSEEEVSEGEDYFDAPSEPTVQASPKQVTTDFGDTTPTQIQVQQPTPVSSTPQASFPPSDSAPAVLTPGGTHKHILPSFLPKKFPRRPGMIPTASYDSTLAPPSRPSSSVSKGRFRRKTQDRDYHFSADNDILGIVMLEVHSAEDLPKLRNMTRTGWDMDPFIVISFGKKVFRTRVIRHSLNPVWDEKLLFHVRRYESNFKINFNLHDWDKLSSNDAIAEAAIDVAELIKNAPQKDAQTGLYPASVDGAEKLRDFKVPLKTSKESLMHKPTLSFSAKFQPYAALRQRFWREYLKQYDTDDTEKISHLELTSMLDSLGSTLTQSTVESFFTRHGKSVDEELTISEAVQCLEAEVCKPREERKVISSSTEHAGDETSGLVTPGNPVSTELSRPPALDKMDFSGPASHTLAVQGNSQTTHQAPVPAPTTGDPSQFPLGTRPDISHRDSSPSSSDADDSTSSGETVERVINIKNCPLCHRPRLNKKAEMDMVTHLAVCASQDWRRVDNIINGNFVTASQAQRKWYTKIISKVSSGAYQLGANSANIIVQNRMTGQLEEEKMQVYVRLGIRLLYKGARSRMEGAKARKLLKSMSIKEGIKYDSPHSAAQIQPFIEFHNLNVNEIMEPISSFKTFNEFFYRKLKPEARPAESPDDPRRLVSGADCRLMAFESVNEATRLWIKGRDFTIARLLGDRYKDQVDRYNGGAVCIFRLAPQDYHRFHSPVDGTIGPMTYISGEYYTVNPQAIRTGLDVYGENARKIVPIDSPSFGRVMCVCVGAMMVGSIKATVKEGETVQRGQEFGYFAFGGSTIVVLFETGVVQWDEDLLINGHASLETLVRVGMGIGRSTKA